VANARKLYLIRCGWRGTMRATPVFAVLASGVIHITHMPSAV
jgi:hypothetical protein